MSCTRFIALVFLLASSVGGMGCSAVDLRRENEELEREVLNLRQDRNRLESELASVEGQKNAATNELRRLQSELIDTKAELSESRMMFSSFDEDGALMGEVEPMDSGVESDDEGEVVETLAGTVLFSPGKAALTAAGQEALARTAARLQRDYRGSSIRIEGHTDSTPVVKSKKQYPTNWELSSARACSVLRFLVESGAVTADRVEAVGYGDTRSVASNSTAEGRAKNRRVVIRVR